MPKKTFLLYIIILNIFSIFTTLDSKKLEFLRCKNQGSLDTNFLKYLKEIFEIKTFIETGTFDGETAKRASLIFDEVHSIELSEILFNRAHTKLKDYKNIFLHLGDSGLILNNIINKDKKTLFWLDAHWNGGDTAKSDDNTPVLNELNSIKKSNLKNSIILIDDILCFQNKQILDLQNSIMLLNQFYYGYPSLEEVIGKILEINEEYKIVIFGNILLAHADNNIGISPLLKNMRIERDLFFNAINNDYIDEILLRTEMSPFPLKNSEKSGILSFIDSVIGKTWFNEKNTFKLVYMLWIALGLINENKKGEALKYLNHIETIYKTPRIKYYIQLATA